MRGIAVAFLLALQVGGCASTPTRDTAVAQTVNYPAASVQRAALDALSMTGFDVEKNEPTYVEGFRPRKFGLFIGSGGETVGVWIEPVSPQTTAVRVDSARSFVGLAGQKSWTADVMNELLKSLQERS